MSFDKLKDPKVWLPLVGTAALGYGAVNGVEVDAAAQEGLVNQITGFWDQLDGLWASGAAVMAAVAGWGARK